MMKNIHDSISFCEREARRHHAEGESYDRRAKQLKEILAKDGDAANRGPSYNEIVQDMKKCLKRDLDTAQANLSEKDQHMSKS